MGRLLGQEGTSQAVTTKHGERVRDMRIADIVFAEKLTIGSGTGDFAEGGKKTEHFCLKPSDPRNSMEEHLATIWFDQVSGVWCVEDVTETVKPEELPSAHLPRGMRLTVAEPAGSGVLRNGRRIHKSVVQCGDVLTFGVLQRDDQLNIRCGQLYQTPQAEFSYRFSTRAGGFEYVENIDGQQALERPPLIADIQGHGYSILPLSICRNTALTKLHMGRNNLLEFPTVLHRHKQLLELDMSENDMKHLHIEQLQKLTNLTSLSVDKNDLQRLDTGLGHLQRLTRLTATHNTITSIADDIWKCWRLRHMDLDYNTLSVLPVGLGHCFNLNTIKCSHNNFAVFPSPLLSLTELKILCLDWNRLQTVPEQVSQLFALQSLSLNHNRLLRLPNTISEMSSLTKLSVSSNQLSELGASLLFDSLVSLDFSKNTLRDGSLPKTTRFWRSERQYYRTARNLTYLSISHNNLSALPDCLSILSGLKEVDISANNFREAPAVAKHFTNLTILDMRKQMIASTPADWPEWIHSVLKTDDDVDNSEKFNPENSLNKPVTFGQSRIPGGGVFEGQCDRNGRPCGEGLAVFRTSMFKEDAPQSNQRSFVGQWQAGRPNGAGTLEWTSGETYKGEWADGARHGRGRWLHPSGVEYDGEWEHGIMHGRGRLINIKRRLEFTGTFCYGQMHGRGQLLEVSTGLTWNGTWEHGKKHGAFIVTGPDETRKRVHYNQGRLLGSSTWIHTPKDENVG